MELYIHGLDYQYYHQIKKGDTVTLSCGTYRAQEDRGNLHIVAHINKQRKKITLKPEMFFEPGSKGDWVINEWWKLYDDYETFRSFVSAEMIWIN